MIKVPNYNVVVPVTPELTLSMQPNTDININSNLRVIPSVRFNGTTDYLSVPANAGFQFGTGDYTVEMWANFASLDGYQNLFSIAPHGAEGYQWLYNWPSNGKLGISVNNGGPLTPTVNFAVGVWYHIASVRSVGVSTLYINGENVGSAADPEDYSWLVDVGIGIEVVGDTTLSDAFLFNGYISNLRVVKGTAVYTANFTPSTLPLTAIAGTSLLTCQGKFTDTEEFVDTSANAFTINKVGNPYYTPWSPFTSSPPHKTPILHYDANNLACYSGGNTIYDLSGNANNGTLDNILGGDDTIANSGKVFKFPTSQPISARQKGLIQFQITDIKEATISITVEMWVNFKQFTYLDDQLILNFGYYTLELWKNSLGFSLWNGDNFGCAVDNKFMNNWHHCVFVLYKSNYSRNRVYIDAVNMPMTQNIGKSTEEYNNRCEFNNWFGSVGFPGDFYNLNGTLDTASAYPGKYAIYTPPADMDLAIFKIYNNELTHNQVTDLFNGTKYRFKLDNDKSARNHNSYEITVDNALTIELPWMPTAPDWVEIYLDGIRVVNPRITSITGGSLFEVFNVTNNLITFNAPITGALKIICDTQSTHFWRSLIINAKNVQGFYVYTTVHDFEILEWKITAGTVNGLTFNVFYKPGPEFRENSYVLIENCVPTVFNGNFKVTHSTPESVTVRGETTLEVRTDDPAPITANRVWYNTTSNIYNHSKLDSITGTIVVTTYTTKSSLTADVNLVASVPGKSYITTPGIISGFGNATVTKLQGISLYAEPIIITQPLNGYARLTTDRKSIAYVPNVSFKGVDTFSWSMINQHGQIGTPKCVQITVKGL